MAADLAARVRPDFPFFQRNAAGPESIYLDSAATSLRPASVVDELARFYTEVSANVHRGRHLLSDLASRLFEESREAVAKLIGADRSAVVFTSGTTGGVNLVAASLALPEGSAVAL